MGYSIDVVLTIALHNGILSLMDIEFIYRGTRFIADAEKAKANPKKHDGVTFEMAAEAFYDPGLVFMDASRNGEDRDAIIGYDTRLRLLFVVHIVIEDQGIRIVSARRATKSEAKQYDFE